MVEVGMEDDEMGDGFGRDIKLVEMAQERIGDRADPTLDDGIGFSSNEIKVKKFASEKGDTVGYVEWELHMISLTHCF